MSSGTGTPSNSSSGNLTVVFSVGKRALERANKYSFHQRDPAPAGSGPRTEAAIAKRRASQHKG
jgi:hypothetical protein